MSEASPPSMICITLVIIHDHRSDMGSDMLFYARESKLILWSFLYTMQNFSSQIKEMASTLETAA